MRKENQIDTYILNCQDFAKPILNRIRKLVHLSCPEVEETMKWSFPHFMYKGSIFCSMAAFKSHCTFGFWKASLIHELSAIFNIDGKEAMGQFGRITSIKDLPEDKIFSNYITADRLKLV